MGRIVHNRQRQRSQLEVSKHHGDNSAADFALSGPVPKNFNGVLVQNLEVSGNVTLTWDGTAPAHRIFKTASPATVRASASVGAIAGTTFNDPNPNQFAGLTCYIVKPFL